MLMHLFEEGVFKDILAQMDGSWMLQKVRVRTTKYKLESGLKARS